MGVRGRKSAASLSVAVTSMPGQRPEPPSHLSAAVAAEWRAIVGRMPPKWFSAENFGLLEAYCSHLVRKRQVEEALDRIEPPSMSDAEGLKAYDVLTRIAEREGRAASSLANRMRLTQASRAARSTAEAAVRHETNGTRPWQRTG
jgi:phage terminase small subunit